jgi:hypothetical protein
MSSSGTIGPFAAEAVERHRRGANPGKIFSDGPASPAIIAVSGTAPEPRLALANGGKFGRCCLGTFVDEPLLLANAGPCKLPVTSIAPSDASFLAPEVDNFPLNTEAASAISAPIRFSRPWARDRDYNSDKRRPGKPSDNCHRWHRSARQALGPRLGRIGWR